MTRFDDLTDAFVSKRRAAQLEWFAHQKCATHLIKTLREVGGISPENLRTETLQGEDVQGEPFKDYLGWKNDWMHLRLRFAIPVPHNLASREGPKHEQHIGVVLQYRHEDNGWFIRFYDDDSARSFVPENDTSVRQICEALYASMIAWLNQKPHFESDSKRVGFYVEPPEGTPQP
jgi:hypothetical protein